MPPVVETANLSGASDSADDPAIWVHPTNPALSVIIGTHKGYGLGVYDLAGRPLQSLASGDVNNVDLRYGFALGSRRVDLVVVSERSDNIIQIYSIDASTRRLTDVAARAISVGVPAIYGICMYRSRTSGRYYAFATSEDGQVEQWELFDNGAGRVDARSVRRFDVGGISEGCVADDEQGYFFVAEEDRGIWRYGAEPSAGTTRQSVDSVGGGALVADVEGLALYYTNTTGGGYLLASSQGSSTFVAYDRRPPHTRLLEFDVTSGGGIDAVTGSDGIEVTQAPLGPSFPSGLFVTHDDVNTGGLENFKLVPWPAIAALATPDLLVDTRRDPRAGGGGGGTGTGCGTTDGDGDGVGDGCDVCPTVPNGAAQASVARVGNQLDSDDDGVGDACDNCTFVPNPLPTVVLAFQTTTGDQLDDDADGWGNACDADFNQAGNVDSTDRTLFTRAYGKLRSSPTACNGGPCAPYDLNGRGRSIDSRDFSTFNALFGSTRQVDNDEFERCPLCGPPYPDPALPCDGDACDGSGGVPNPGGEPPPGGQAAVLVGAGDIASCSSTGDDATADVLDDIVAESPSAIVFTTGDNVYSSGTSSEFNNCYDESWGRHLSRTRPSPGNHDYETSGAAGYFDYFGDIGLYYSYDVGDWHVVMLNSNIDRDSGSAQIEWLRDDLAASTKRCTVAMWHHPRFSSGDHHGSDSSMGEFWNVLYQFGVELVINGHEHHYERFAPMNASGQRDATRGIREIVVGTGGRSHYSFGSPLSTSEVRNSTTFGVLKLTLLSTGYQWEFVPVAGASFTDSGSGSCH